MKQAAARQNDDRNQEQPDKRVVINFSRKHLFKRDFRERTPDQKHRAERVRPGDRPDCLVHKSGKLELGYQKYHAGTEIEQLQQLVGKGVEVEIRQVPNDRKQLFAECV